MSTQERLFKTLVSKSICKKVPFSETREKRLLTFYTHAEYCYDIFCEAVYTMMSTNSIHTISIDEYGYTRIDAEDNSNIIGYELLSKEDVAHPSDDIIVYVDLALERLAKRLQRGEERVGQLRQPIYKEIKLL